MQHRNHESNAWLITHANSLLDTTKAGTPLWEHQCRGKGNEAALYSTEIATQSEAETYQQYLLKKGMKANIEATQARNAFQLVLPVASQQMKKTRFNTTHTEISNTASLDIILTLLNEATPAELGKWEVSANHNGQRMLMCLEHRKLLSPHDDDAALLNMINNVLAKGAFSEESRRSIRHYFLDNLYVELHDNYTSYSIIDLAFMEQIATIASMSQ